MELTTIDQAIAGFVDETALNAAAEIGLGKIFDQPLVGVASATDVLFENLQAADIVGPQHLLPRDWLAGAQSVITYFLPFTQAVRVANRQGDQPAVEWLYARIEGELVNNAVRRFLVAWFAKAGYQAVAPGLDARFAVVSRKSNWSERHVAFVAGLGTFSLNRSFITQAGAAGRLGSVIVTAPVQATPRKYQRHDEYCSKCGACIRRCPPQAIDNTGKNNDLCAAFLDRTAERYKPRYGCGKCQTAVPCEAGVPV
ncbi:epoxyqueuosine reductase [Sporomusa termitida]|uniref:Epoxyqueuosine reductase n=1 Tax=Sporomusa termitida TaxID=2377 RepID=A0A517DXW6_9FIRM|nr:epoxyqueuosine reductase [Sporomusa termitida]QDR82183.1 Epoxyqueuosine reductase [Sporomusa termitida]